MDNFALVVRPATFSWEAMTLLEGDTQETETVKVIFPRRTQIVSIYPSIAVAGGDVNLDVPTLDDLLVKIEIDSGNERRLTSRYDTVQPNGVGSLPNVTLGSFRDSTGGARVIDYIVGAPDSRPEIQVVFTWKRDITGGPWFRDIYVGALFECNFV